MNSDARDNAPPSAIQRTKDQLERDALVAAAMAFAPATDVPRDRVVMRSALTSLVADFPEAAFARSEAVTSIRRHGELVELRDEYAKEIFDKLVEQKALLPADNDASTYRVSDTVREELRRTSDELERLFDKVVVRLFGEASNAQRAELKTSLVKCLSFIMRDYGRQYAYQVSGRTEESFSPGRGYLLSTCQRVLTKRADAETMADAIAQLFNEDDPAFARLAFCLTQSFYFLNLLGLAGGLSYFSQERFRGAEMFIDTNLLFAFLVPESRHRRSVIELTTLGQQLLISFHVSESTLDEFKGVVTHQRSLAGTYDAVPDDLVADVKREVLFHAYRTRKRAHPDLTTDVFFSELDDVRGRLSNEWKVEVLDHHFDSQEDKAFCARAKQEIQAASRFYRRKDKSENALEHDAHLLQLVRSERMDFGDRTAWVLTLDTSLVPAAKELRDLAEQPWCMTLDGFLQVLSPYVRTDREQDFAEHFMRVISRNLFTPEDVLELDDFRMFTDMDLSVRRLPAGDVRKVIRSVRDAVGDDLRSDRRNVAYAVQKALSDPTLAYRTSHEAEVTGLRDTIAQAEELHRAMEAEALQRQSTVDAALSAVEREAAAVRAEAESRAAKLEHELHLAKHGLSEKEQEVERHANSAKEKDDQHALEIARHRRHFWLALATVSALVAIVVVWLLPGDLFAFVRPGWVIRIGITTAALAMLLGQYLRWTLLARLGLAVSIGSLVGGLGKLASPHDVTATPTRANANVPVDGGLPVPVDGGLPVPVDGGRAVPTSDAAPPIKTP